MQQIVNCPNCGSPNAPGQKFCGACGGQLPVGCPNCGAGIEPGARFCGNCGAQLPGMQQQPGGWGQPPGGMQQQPGGWRQSPGGYGQTPPRSTSSSGTLLLVLLVVLIVGLGGFGYWAFFGTPPWASSGGSNGTNGTSGDTTPPGISNINLSSSGDDSTGEIITITWATDELAFGRVEYGKTQDYGSFTDWEKNKVVTHFISLTDLDKATKYHYRVISKDAAENTAKAGDETFTTK